MYENSTTYTWWDIEDGVGPLVIQVVDLWEALGLPKDATENPVVLRGGNHIHHYPVPSRSRSVHCRGGGQNNRGAFEGSRSGRGKRHLRERG
mgnify:CR=1 FL=1